MVEYKNNEIYICNVKFNLLLTAFDSQLKNLSLVTVFRENSKLKRKSIRLRHKDARNKQCKVHAYLSTLIVIFITTVLYCLNIPSRTSDV